MNWFSYRTSLRKLRSLEKKVKDQSDKKIEEAYKSGNNTKAIELEYDKFINLTVLEEEIYELETQRLISKADKFIIQIPEKPAYDPEGLHTENEYWRMGERSIWYLKPKGIAELRTLIRQEEKYRRDKTAFWISIISGSIIGIIGALTGLIAIINR